MRIIPNVKILFPVLILVTLSCGENNKRNRPDEEKLTRTVNVPVFNADSAYGFIKKQVSFGPRVPNTEQHRKAGSFLEKTLMRYGATVVVQEFQSLTFDGQLLDLKNIIASFHPEKKNRILLAAHWDTRPFADKDETNPYSRFDGANDGASGVGVLLEVARVLSTSNPPDVGIDIILFDGEDWGETFKTEPPPLPDGLDAWWCLGSQYWSKNKHRNNYNAHYGIVLDMVGAKDAHFHREGYSLEYAPDVVAKVWNAADKLGYSHFFLRKDQEGVIDDHLFVNSIGRIPTINIVHYEPGIGFFGDFHHTTSDNLDGISPATLEAVGRTVLHVIYNEEG